MSDRFHRLIIDRFPEHGRLRALETYEEARRREKRTREDFTVLFGLTHCLNRQDACNGIVIGMSATLAALCIMVLVHYVFIPYELSGNAGFLIVMAVFGAWFALYKAAQRAIERRAVREFAEQIAAIDSTDSLNDLK